MSGEESDKAGSPNGLLCESSRVGKRARDRIGRRFGKAYGSGAAAQHTGEVGREEGIACEPAMKNDGWRL